MKARDSAEILLVEDNPHDVELTLRAFKKRNINQRVYVVRDGEEALQYLFAEGPYADRKSHDTPRVILLDLKLPKVSGLEVLHQLKGQERTRAIPVVIVSSSREESDVLESYQAGVNSYIVKPIGFEEFMDAVATLAQYWLKFNEPPRWCYPAPLSPAVS